jgi:hypothetical protein
MASGFLAFIRVHSRVNLFSNMPPLPLRLAIGLLILTALALLDLRRHGRQATRWREYAFLFLTTAAAVCYGVLNDQLTSTISWEYFYYGKDLAGKLGPQTPPDPLNLHLHAALVGVQATWTAGLILGVALLLANNPTKSLPRLPYRDLFRLIPLIFAITAATAAVGALLGYLGLLTPFNEDFPILLKDNLWRPRRFMAVYGIHLGGYLGALLALSTSTLLVLRQRRRLRVRGFQISPPAPTPIGTIRSLP